MSEPTRFYDFNEEETIADDCNLDDIDITELARGSPLLARLVEEVRLEEKAGTLSYNRMHNRHNRSIRPTRPSPTLPRPEPEPKPDE